MKVKCKVTNQFTDEIFNLAKLVQKRQTLTDSVVLYQSANKKRADTDLKGQTPRF